MAVDLREVVASEPLAPAWDEKLSKMDAAEIRRCCESDPEGGALIRLQLMRGQAKVGQNCLREQDQLVAFDESLVLLGQGTAFEHPADGREDVEMAGEHRRVLVRRRRYLLLRYELV